MGHTWIVFFFIHSILCIYTHTIYIKYTYFMHIFWCFMHKHCIPIHYIQDYFTPKFYAENRLLAKPHIYTPHFPYIEPTHTSVYIGGLFDNIDSFSLHTNFWLKTPKKEHTISGVLSMCSGGHTTLYASYPLPHLNHSKRQ